MQHFTNTIRAILLLAMASVAGASWAQVVSNTADSGPGSLREALTNGTADVSFASGLDGRTVTLNSPITISRDVEIASAFNASEEGVTISGPQGALRFSGDYTAKFYNVSFANSSAVSGGAIWSEGTDVFVFGGTFSANVATGDDANQGGGAIYVAGARLYVEDARFVDNRALGASGSGGAILLGDGARLQLLRSELTGNSASRAGGGVEDQSGGSTTAEYFENAFTGNLTGDNPGNGGAVHVTGAGNSTFFGGTVNANRAAAEGGGLWNGSGRMTVSDVTFEDNVGEGDGADNGGGALFNNGGFLRVDGATAFTNNAAPGASGSGGAILIVDGSELEVYGATFTGNSASRAGGAIEDQSGATTTVVLASANFSDNTTGSAPGNGGGIHITGPGNMSIHGGAYAGNVATNEGGALWNGSGTMVVSGATFTANKSQSSGMPGGGGAVFNKGGVLAVRDATFDGNEAGGAASASGGAIFNDESGRALVERSSFRENTALRAGGAIEDASNNNLQVFNSTFTGNSTGDSPGNGGAVHVTGTADVQVRSSAFDGNAAATEGGALWNGTGTMQISESSFTDNTAAGDDADTGGGAIFNVGGTVRIFSNTNITDNAATGASGSGGGILNVNGGTLALDGVTLTGNTASRAGGGIEDNGGGTLSVANATFTGNATGPAPGNGGGIHITGPGDITITESSFVENDAATEGGGFWNGSGTATVTNTRFTRNTARGDDATNGGGGIFNLAGAVDLRNVYLGYNVASGASGSGGGILFNEGSTGSLDIVTLEYNTASRAGGGIEDQSGADSGTISVRNSQINWNETGPAPGNGGGIHITGPGDMTIESTQFTNNVATAEGGGFWNGSGTTTIRNSQFFDNDAQGDAATNGGGAIFALAGTVDVSFATIARNSASGASGSGGGILFNEGATGSVSFTTFEANSASRAGGGIEDQSGAGTPTIAIADATFRANLTGPAPGNGGGIHITGPGNMDLARVGFFDNTATREGGGFWNGSGTSTLSRVRFERNVASGDDAANGGGGIFNLAGTIDVIDSYIGYNRAEGASGSGGGILFVEGSGGSVTNTLIEYNDASRAGGGIEDQSGASTTIVLTETDLLWNSTGDAPGNGGGVHITGPGDMDITGGTVAYNSAAAEGGGLWNGSGTMNVTDVNVTYNRADGQAVTNGGGGIFNNGGTLEVLRTLVAYNEITGERAIGGGIHNASPGTTAVSYSTVSNNRSAWNAGGIANAGTLTVTGSTIAQNAADNRGGGVGQAVGATTATLRSSIFALNTAPVQGMQLDVAAGAYVSEGFNLVSADDADVFPAGPTDKEGTAAMPIDAGLQPLNNNGGMTETHGLDCTSPAIGMGDPGLDGDDQRGFAIVNRRDIGAHERQDVCANNPGQLVDETMKEASFAVFPTNAVSEVTIAIEDAVYDPAATYTFQVVSSDGELVRTVESDSDRVNLGVMDFRAGVYFVRRISADSTVETRSFQRR